MAKVRISDLVPGMVLGEDVLTSGGRFLMPRGARLDRSHLTTLAGWGLDAVEVATGEDASSQGGGRAGRARFGPGPGVSARQAKAGRFPGAGGGGGPVPVRLC